MSDVTTAPNAESIAEPVSTTSPESEPASQQVFVPPGPNWCHFDFTPQYGLPTRNLPDIRDRIICEKNCGIDQYIGPDVKGFKAIVKHRYSDFNVFEIGLDGEVVRLKSTDVPKDAQAEDVNRAPVPYNELDEGIRGIVDKLTFTRLQMLAKKYEEPANMANPSDEDKVRLDVTTKTKDDRRLVHKFVQQHFPNMCSNFKEEDGKKFIVVFYVKVQKRRVNNEWPKGRPKYLQFHLYKEDLEHNYVFGQLSKFLNHPMKERFQVAGMKDKRGRTTQKVTVKYVTPEMLDRAYSRSYLRPDRVLIGDFQYVEQELKLGDLKGNRFSIALRNVTGEESTIVEALEALKKNGFLNYFGLQRFGTASVKTSDIGVALIKQNWEKAIELVMLPRSNEKPFISKARQFWWEYRNAREALRILGRKNENLVEGRLLMGLKMTDNAIGPNAFNFIHKNVRLMYLHAYQSYVFNRVLSERVKRHGLKVLVGDLYVKKDVKLIDEAVLSEGVEATNEEKNGQNSNGKPEKSFDVLLVTEENISEVEIGDVVLPLPGYKAKYPENELKDVYEKVMAEDEITFTSFKHPEKSYALGGDYRKIVGLAGDLEWRFVRYSDPNANLILSEAQRLQNLPEITGNPDDPYLGLVVDFSLDSSHYATMALREALKIDTGKAYMSEMTEVHMNEYNAMKRKLEPDSEGAPPFKRCHLDQETLENL